MKRAIFALALLIAGANATQSWAIKYETIESECIYTVFQSTANDTNTTSVDFTTNQVSGLLLSWQIEAIGGNATFTIAHTTAATPTLIGPGAFTPVVVSSEVTVSAGKVMSDDVRGMMKNPRIRVTDLTAPATAYVRMVYCLAPAVNP